MIASIQAEGVAINYGTVGGSVGVASSSNGGRLDNRGWWIALLEGLVGVLLSCLQRPMAAAFDIVHRRRSILTQEESSPLRMDAIK